MPEPTPDYFDRLLARHTGRGDTAGTRPRLPGPFERGEARWQEVEMPPLPAAHPVVQESGERPPTAPVRVERHTEIRIGQPDPGPPGPAPASPLRTTESRSVEPVPGRETVTRVISDPPVPPAAAAPQRPAPSASASADRPAAGPAPVMRPAARVAPVAAARRETVQPPASRRRARPAEPSVHVTIGRLEVRATAPERAPARTPRSGRPAPAVTLTDYLAGEGRR
ncbi:hypothetical protein FHR83_003778 [Actinoplanes campanulatus]|uniref:Uncharacterized protein n=1 Tax=Actinoplanes campanulatus TaxID=113559 RepID=A0A7W5AH41_9ACTN|nr:hypothetical protein [Actinoplanes campanulatus]MBB3096108.1 hypothetical protein [Actinoplanes campanulatus]GGN13774.1 hypothetical protein GCM10010109_24930 [Actinoplanes campanulatus]GID36797.1 hypothetical protein Aca09nite_33030 [Actinoplanes campanulatus]